MYISVGTLLSKSKDFAGDIIIFIECFYYECKNTIEKRYFKLFKNGKTDN